MALTAPAMSISRLRDLVDVGDVDTVIVAFTDLQGRLQGARVHARHFLDEVLEGGLEVGSHLLSVDVDMATAPGYGASWEKGFGDLVLRPDVATLRAAPWLPSSAMVQCDVHWPDGKPVESSPRHLLTAQAARAAGLGFSVVAGTDVEFMVFEDGYEQAWDRGFRDLVPAGRYNADTSLRGTSRNEPLLRELRTAMSAAGMPVQAARGGSAPGQHAIGFGHGDVVTVADQHVVYKAAAREIAARHDRAVTFMAQYDQAHGNACRLTVRLRGLEDDGAVFADGPGGRSPLFRHFLAGVLATMREFTLLYAPNVNSYKRFRPGSPAPTAVAWGEDNRSCALRVVGRGDTLRIENRVPGGDANPYLALAAMVAGGLHGIDFQLPLEAALEGDPQQTQRKRVPSTLYEARDEFYSSQIARNAFGEEVVVRLLTAADIELDAFQEVVTEWERRRGFERL